MAKGLDEITQQPVFLGATRSGLRNVGSYQVSGHPYITGSTIAANVHQHVEFPFVTKTVTVIASGSMTTGGHLRVHFHTASAANRVEAGNHYISLNSASVGQDSITFDVKCKELWISAAPGTAGGYQIYASLTTIPTGSMFALSGSGVTD
jgi:hypothetical protein